MTWCREEECTFSLAQIFIWRRLEFHASETIQAYGIFRTAPAWRRSAAIGALEVEEWHLGAVCMWRTSNRNSWSWIELLSKCIIVKGTGSFRIFMISFIPVNRVVALQKMECKEFHLEVGVKNWKDCCQRWLFFLDPLIGRIDPSRDLGIPCYKE